MSDSTRVFILGAGFSKPAGMPLATEVLPLLLEDLEVDENDEMRTWLDGLRERLAWLSECVGKAGWLDGLRERLAWLSECVGKAGSFALNIEQVFHYAHFDVEVYRLRQQLAPVGRGAGPGTPWKQAESIGAWLSHLEDALRDVVLRCDNESVLAPINRWAETVRERDAVLTFNYDTLVERGLRASGKRWNHGFESEEDGGIPVFKLHGSIDWIVAHRRESFSKLDLVFEKQNVNKSDRDTGHVEDDYRLWRCRTPGQLSEWIQGRDLQQIPRGAAPATVGIAGLGAYKELHRIPGLGRVWARGMRALYQADLGLIVGFSMSDFDAMAQMQFAEVARSRQREERPLRLIVVDPFIDADGQNRFRRVFRFVEFVRQGHETLDWASLG